jgi:hypothetical protein
MCTTRRIIAAITTLAVPAALAAVLVTGPAATAASAAGPVPACFTHAQLPCF